MQSQNELILHEQLKQKDAYIQQLQEQVQNLMRVKETQSAISSKETQQSQQTAASQIDQLKSELAKLKKQLKDANERAVEKDKQLKAIQQKESTND